MQSSKSKKNPAQSPQLKTSDPSFKILCINAGPIKAIIPKTSFTGNFDCYQGRGLSEGTIYSSTGTYLNFEGRMCYHITGRHCGGLCERFLEL